VLYLGLTDINIFSSSAKCLISRGSALTIWYYVPAL